MTAPTRAPGPLPDEQGDLDRLVNGLRARIDDLDRSVVHHIQERRELSRRIQQARVAAGGVRIELSREREVLDRYAHTLGRDGTALATAVLRSCRGSA